MTTPVTISHNLADKQTQVIKTIPRSGSLAVAVAR